MLASGTETIEAVGNNTTEVESQRMNRPAGPGPCKFCGVLIVAESVACQGCGCRFHTDVLCLGLGREFVQVLRLNNPDVYMLKALFGDQRKIEVLRKSKPIS